MAATLNPSYIIQEENSGTYTISFPILYRKDLVVKDLVVTPWSVITYGTE